MPDESRESEQGSEIAWKQFDAYSRKSIGINRASIIAAHLSRCLVPACGRGCVNVSTDAFTGRNSCAFTAHTSLRSLLVCQLVSSGVSYTVAPSAQQYLAQHCSLGPSESGLKRHLDQFSRFIMAHERDQQTDTTDHATPCVAMRRRQKFFDGYEHLDNLLCQITMSCN